MTDKAIIIWGPHLYDLISHWLLISLYSSQEPPYCSLNTADTSLLQGLCTGHSLCLVYSSKMSTWLTPSLPSGFAQMSSRPMSQPPPGSPAILIFSTFSVFLLTYNTIYLFVILIALSPAVDYKLQESRDVCFVYSAQHKGHSSNLYWN